MISKQSKWHNKNNIGIYASCRETVTNHSLSIQISLDYKIRKINDMNITKSITTSILKYAITG
ncbi:MAG: hypothetical protein DBY35_12415 [Bacteroidales bacterium]|nr:MAG: hypothetical protein DBY35_12415 [Bacteroidales bacterium]